MFANGLWLAAEIIADEPDHIDRHVKQLGQYLREFWTFITDTAVKHPNEFVIAVATFFIAIFTAMLAIAAVRLWNSTAELARLAEQQASDMKAFIDLAKKSADAASTAADIAERTLTFTARPWIDVEIELTGPLTFNARECSVPIRITFKNIGNSPATSVGFDCNLYPTGIEANDREVKLLEILKRIRPQKAGKTLFPASVVDEEITVSFTREAMEKSKSENAIDLVLPTILVCVYYGIPSRGPRGRYHHTVHARGIRLTETASTGPGFDGREGTFAEKDLRLVFTEIGTAT
jgi:hypothetical protein